MSQNPHYSLEDKVTFLSGVGVKRAEALQKLGIETIADLLAHYPVRYEDRRHPAPIATLKNGEPTLCRVLVRRIVTPPPFSVYGSRAPKIPMKIYAEDDSGSLTLLFFNTRWIASSFNIGDEYWIYGVPRKDMTGISMTHPDFEPVPANMAQDAPGAGIVPVYPLTAGITQKYLRGLMRTALPAAKESGEIIPEEIVRRLRLAPRAYAVSQIHFPLDEHALSAAKYRLVFEELFLFQVRLLSMRGREQDSGGMRISADSIKSSDAQRLFSYELTGAQIRAIEDIYGDMTNEKPMKRLLQGDVGSGKTAVAAAAVLFAIRSGFQAAIMAPTEILAAQHRKEFGRFFANENINIGLLTSGLPAKEKAAVKSGLKSGSVQVVIGTHALIEPDIIFSNLGLVITDEQHRFGVRQRLSLKGKGISPDTLVMTATPIPRTLALMMYADLDVSALDEMPPGRKPVLTKYVDYTKRDAVYDFAEKEMSAGRQVYVVAPSIGEGEDDAGWSFCEDEPEAPAMASAIGLADELAERFPGRKIGLLYGSMSNERKESVMKAFSEEKIELLVSTIVIEVGVDVPNATVMIIENAERYGLAQLHQLRGRVGRGSHKSYCVLLSDSKSEIALKRCETLASTTDGFKIAELDLTLRGQGDIFGVRQHGQPGLKLADPAKHIEILRAANEAAHDLVKTDPNLENPGHSGLREALRTGFSDS